jgi:hypothetical protein
MELITEDVEATHDEDFREHLNMYRKHTHWGGSKNKGHFAHVYVRNRKKKSHEADDSHDKFHGIMDYHGYEARKKKKTDGEVGDLHFHREDEHKSHKIAAVTNHHGEVVAIIHQERFKKVDESKINETKTFGKTLRSLVPKKSKLPTGADSVLNSPAAPGERDEQKKLLGLRDIIKFPDANGNEAGFATSKSPAKKPKEPGVGYLAPMTKIKEEQELVELDRSTLQRYAGKAQRDHRPGKIKKREAGTALALKKVYGDKKYGFSEPRVKAGPDRTNEETIDELHGKGSLDAIAAHHAGKEMHHSFQARRDRVENGNADARGHESKAKVASATVDRAKQMRVRRNNKLRI